MGTRRTENTEWWPVAGSKLPAKDATARRLQRRNGGRASCYFYAQTEDIDRLVPALQHTVEV
jgi:selenocysteine lyase/cysteine desulfurase